MSDFQAFPSKNIILFDWTPFGRCNVQHVRQKGMWVLHNVDGTLH